MDMGGYGICDRICLHIWQSAIIRPSIQSIHLSAHHLPHFLLCPVGRTLAVCTTCSSLERTSVFHRHRAPRIRIPVSPQSPRSLPVSRFPIGASLILRPASSSRTRYPRSRLTVLSAHAGARGGAQSIPVRCLVGCRKYCTYRSDIVPRLLTRHARRVVAVPPPARLLLPRLRSRLQPASISTTASRLPLTASKA